MGNYNRNWLELQSDGGFVLGKSTLGIDKLISEEDSWLDILDDFLSIELDRHVAIEKGVFFRPEVATLTLRTTNMEFLEGARGRRMRLMWEDTPLFVGEVIHASYTPDKRGEKNVITLKAVDTTARAVGWQQVNFTAPQETVAQRVKRLMPDAVVYGCDRVIRARAESTVELSTLMREAVDTQIARYYVDANNQVVVDGRPAPEPLVTLTDQSDDDVWSIEYSSLSLEENIAYTITGAVVEVKGDDGDPVLKAYQSHPSAVIVNENKYEPAVPYNQIDVNAWAASFPLKGAPSMAPSRIRAPFYNLLTSIDLCQRIGVLHDGRTYDAGVTGIRHTITPDKWMVDLECIPGHVLSATPVLAPSAVRNLTATPAVDSVALLWQMPLSINSLDGYEVRFLAGAVAPANRDEGTLLATLAPNQLTYSHTGRTSNTQYSYSVWALTDDDEVYSPRSTVTTTTLERIPSAPRNLTVTRGANAATATVDWDAPSTVGDLAYYELWVKAAGEPVTRVGVTATAFITTDLDRNTTYDFTVNAITGKGAKGPSVATTYSTAETVPAAVTGLTATATAYNNIALSWTGSANAADLSHYVVFGKPGPTAPTAYFESGSVLLHQSSATSLNHAVNGNEQWSYSVWPQTVGGTAATRASASATTPVGIVSRYWEGAASWTRTYKGDGTKRTDGSGTLMYQGYSSSSNGNMGSLAGFALPSDVHGAYAVDRVELHWTQQHTYFNNGATWYVGYHTNTSEPGTFVNHVERVAAYNVPKTGGVGLDVSAWLAQHLRNGAKGIVFGRAPSTSNAYYGYAGTPTIKIWYRTIS